MSMIACACSRLHFSLTFSGWSSVMRSHLALAPSGSGVLRVAWDGGNSGTVMHDHVPFAIPK